MTTPTAVVFKPDKKRFALLERFLRPVPWQIMFIARLQPVQYRAARLFIAKTQSYVGAVRASGRDVRSSASNVISTASLSHEV